MTKVLEDFSKGDVVEIIYRFKVKDLYLTAGYCVSESGRTHLTYAPEIHSIRVLKKAGRRKFAVGDIIKGSDFDSLPVDTVITDEYGGSFFIVVEPGVLKSLNDGSRCASIKFIAPRKIISLPDSYIGGN